MKQKKLLLILCGALALLLAVYLLAGGALKNRSQAEAQADEQARTIFSLDGLSRLAYTDGVNALSFTQSGGVWVSDAHEDWALRQNYLKTLETLLCGLKAERVLEEPEVLKVYGLNNPDYEITMTDSAGTAHILRLALADNGVWYLSVDGEDRVYTVSSELSESVGATLLELVDYETAPSIITDDISSVELAYAGSVYLFRHAAAAQTGEGDAASSAQRIWTAEKDGAAISVDSINIDSAAINLLDIVPTSCIAYDPTAEQLAEYGFDAPLATFKVTYEDEAGNAASYTLLIGKAYGDDASSYTVMMDGGRAVTLADADNIGDLFPLLTSTSAA